MRWFAFLAAAALAPAALAAQETPAHVGSAVCADCHVAEAEAWSGSHHALAWTAPSADAIVADFDGTAFEHDGMTARFRVEPDGSHHVTVTEKDGATRDYPVHSVIGIEPLQQYVLETEPGRLQSFDVVWATEERRWLHLYPDQDLPPDDGLHWTGPYKNWNSRCAECHATGFRKNYDPQTRRYASTQAEIGVGCEACHGPGAAHLDWAAGREIARFGLNDYGFAVAFDNAEAGMQQCAGCHSRRETFLDGNPPPGAPYHDSYNLSLLRPGLYHADGQILDEVYVYGSFLQSRMYAAGVACTDCHEPHAARLKAEGNAVCTQCHNPGGRADFPGAAGDYDSPAHHFHEAGTDGAACKSCHMIERTYMQVDGRRDHSFRIPRPDLSATTGAPDACTDCHADRSPDWAAARIAEMHPDPRHRGPHYGETLTRGRKDATLAADDLADLAADATRPGIVRATALWLLEQAQGPDAADRLAALLEDDDPLIRAAATGLQRNTAPFDRVSRLVPLLDDPARLVRMSAARHMLDAPIARLPVGIAADLRDAMTEWRASLANRLDFPETHLQLGGMALTMRNMPAAAGAFREAVRLDPQLVDAWAVLARIVTANEGPAAGRAALTEAVRANPDSAALRAMLAEAQQP